MKNIVTIAIITALVIAVLWISNMTGLLVYTEETEPEDESEEAGTYCGDGSCNGHENCGNCVADCGLCILRSTYVNVELEWENLHKSENATELCGDYDMGNVYGSIELSENLKQGTYICTAELAGSPKTRWSIGPSGRYVMFAKDRALKENQFISFCCYSYTTEPDFCKTLVLPAYC